MARLLTLQFENVCFLKLFLIQKSHSPFRKKTIFEKQTKKVMTLLFGNCGQVIDPIYIYIMHAGGLIWWANL